MSCLMSAILLKHCINKSYKSFLQANLSSLTSAMFLNQKMNLSEIMHVSNNLKPLISLPVNEILSCVDARHVSGTESVTFLKALRMHTIFNKVPPENFNTDRRFKQLCLIFHQNCRFLDINLLISGLRSLLEIEISPHSVSIVNAEVRILKNIKKMSSFQLIQCLYFHHRFQKTDLQKQVVKALYSELENKLHDISTTAEILLLSQIFDLFNEKNQNVITQKIVEFASLLNVHEMCKIMCLLAQKSNRNVPVLNSIAFHMRMKKEFIGIKETVDLLYAFKKLNFFDTKLLLHLLNNAAQEVPEIKQTSSISGLLSACGHLKLKHTGLLDACTEWIQTHLKTCGNRELISFILTTATLTYATPRSRNLINAIIPNLTTEVEMPSNVLLDVAWSLAILNNVPKKFLLNILSEEFYKPLLDDSDTQKRDTNVLKLLNLKGVLKMHHPECIFKYSLYLEPIKIKESSEIENSRKHVINILSNFVPKENCLSTFQCNDMGIFVDAEFIMDKNFKPLSLSEYGIMTKPAKHAKSLPNGAKRIALLIMFHKDFTLGHLSYTGINAMSKKLLSFCGYSVVRISFDDFMKNTTEVQKAKYLVQNIKMVLQNPEKNEQ